MELKELQQNWDEFGNTDPLWAVLSWPEKRHGRWRHKDFFATGEAEVDAVMHYLAALCVSLGRQRRLDFGCGVGRLTQAMCGHFQECVGVDIAPSMIRLARKYNRHAERCQYLLNAADNLQLFSDRSFDLVYSNIVLQHMKPEYSKNYIREFVRILSPGGVAIFQLPSDRVKPAPMPDAAFAPEPTVDQAKLFGYVGDAISLPVVVKNVSEHPWTGVRLGNHWRDAGGTMIQRDDGRTALPAPFNPGQEVQVTLLANVPKARGEYLLELDLVQEEVSWFADKGSSTLSLPCTVQPRFRPLRLLLDRFGKKQIRIDPVMQMYNIPRPEVIQLVESLGAQVAGIEPNYSAGKEWTSYQYCIKRP